MKQLTRKSYTKWNFVVSQHGRVRDTGNNMNCSLTLETPREVLDETTLADELEVLLYHGIIPHFGSAVSSIREIRFHWERIETPDGEPKIVTSVTMTYTALGFKPTPEKQTEILKSYS